MLPKAEQLRLVGQLAEFGLNDREAAIYIQCLGIGPAPVQEIARKLNQNRITVHSAVEQLVKKGFLFETRKGKRRLIAAERPAVLDTMVARKENELRAMKSSVNDIVNMLSGLAPTDPSVPTVKFYEETDGFKRMLEETLTAKGEVLVFTYVDLFSSLVGPNYLEGYFERRSAKGIKTRLIFPPCPFARRVNKKAAEYKIQIRLLPPQIRWQAGIFSWNDCLAFKSFTRGKITTTIIENADLAHFYRTVVYELCWRQATPME